jgi:hypothetical protein
MYIYRQASGFALTLSRVQSSLEAKSKIGGCGFLSSKPQNIELFKSTTYPKTLQQILLKILKNTKTPETSCFIKKIYGFNGRTSCKRKP